MSVPTDFLQDPYALVDPNEAFLAGEVGTPDTEAHDPGLDLGKVALVLGAAFVIYRVLMRQEMAKHSPPRSDGEARRLVYEAWKAVAPLWLRASLPAVTRAYQLGSTKDISYEEMEKLATDYAMNLGEYINETSSDALVEGFKGGLSMGWNESLAWIRSTEGFGLDSRQMKAYIQTATGDGYDPIGLAAKKMVDAGIGVRAERLGENEAFAASQMGKVIVWMTMAVDGELPPGTKKKWVTANDERVCPVCGPLDQDQVAIHSFFRTQDGQKFYAPGVHPNCRCQIELAYPDVVTKALGSDPYDRDPEGRFAAREQRQTRVRLRQMDPDLQDLLNRAAEVATPAEPRTDLFSAKNEKSLFDAPSSLFTPVGRSDLFAQKIDLGSPTSLTSDLGLARSDLYSSKYAKARRKVIHHIVLGGGVGGGNESPDLDEWAYHDEPVFFSGDGFSAHWSDIPLLGQSKPAGARPTYRVGSTVSIDDLSRWNEAKGEPDLASVPAWGIGDDEFLSMDHPRAAEAALLASLQTGLELNRVARNVKQAERTAASSRLDDHMDPEDFDPLNVIDKQPLERLKTIIEAAADYDGMIGDVPIQSVMNNLPSDPEAQRADLIDFITEAIQSENAEMIRSVEDNAEVDIPLSEDDVTAAMANAEATIDPNWTPTVVQSMGYWGGAVEPSRHGNHGRLVEGSYEVVDRKKGYINPERLRYLLDEYMPDYATDALLATSPLMERGEYLIVVVKPTEQPRYVGPE